MVKIIILADLGKLQFNTDIYRDVIRCKKEGDQIAPPQKKAEVIIIYSVITVHPEGTALLPLLVQDAALFLTNVPVAETPSTQYAV